MPCNNKDIIFSMSSSCSYYQNNIGAFVAFDVNETEKLVPPDCVDAERVTGFREHPPAALCTRVLQSQLLVFQLFACFFGISLAFHFVGHLALCVLLRRDSVDVVFV